MRRAATAIGLVLSLLLAVPLASEIVVSHYRRLQVSRLLVTLRGLHPGTTTETQARAALKPFSRYEEISEQQSEGIAVRRVEYQFFNSPDWISFLAYHLRFIPVRFTLPWTLFEVEIDFANDYLAKMKIVEMQEDQPGFPHPNSVSVSILSNRLSQLPKSTFGSLPADFGGYHDYSRSTGGLDKNGNFTDFICCHARFIELDERATTTQFSQSLNFQLRCLTSFVRCKDDRQILP